MSVQGRRVVGEPATISRRFTVHVRRRPLIELSRRHGFAVTSDGACLCAAFAAVPRMMQKLRTLWVKIVAVTMPRKI